MHVSTVIGIVPVHLPHGTVVRAQSSRRSLGAAYLDLMSIFKSPGFKLPLACLKREETSVRSAYRDKYGGKQ